LVTFPDGSKKHIGRPERDDLLFSGLAKEIGPRKYRFTGQVRTLHSFPELEFLAETVIPSNLKRFLPGSFVIERDGKRTRELLETAGAMAYRLRLYPGQAAHAE
jgi:hypothetical protein